MELISAFAVVLISFVTILYGYFKYSFQYWKSKNVPFDEPSIPFGNLKDKRPTQIHFSEYFYNKYKNKGCKLCGMYFFARPLAILLDLDLIKDVLIKDFAYFPERGHYYK